MPLPIEIRQVEDHRDLTRLTNFGVAQNLDYPDFRDWWHEKATRRTETGYALSIIAVHEMVVVAAEMLYLFPEENRAEAKFFRTAPEFGDEGTGTHLWRQGELLARRAVGIPDDQTLTLTLDTPEDNGLALSFFEKRGCEEIGRTQLYTPARRDILLTKQVRAPRRRTE
jgi:ribosomal protein S18 acetylase RimI-like enzyme